MQKYLIQYSEIAEYRQTITAATAKGALRVFKQNLHNDVYTPDEIVVENCEVTEVGAV